MIKVLTAQHPAEAHMVRDFLVGQGIQAEVRGEMLTGLAGELPVQEAAPTIWIVDEEKAEEATRLVADFFKEANESPQEDWTCPTCQETHEGQFTSCWSCGGARP